MHSVSLLAGRLELFLAHPFSGEAPPPALTLASCVRAPVLIFDAGTAPPVLGLDSFPTAYCRTAYQCEANNWSGVLNVGRKMGGK